MNINFLVEKEKERVVVSNQKGTMNPREYQDNIKEILIKEDVVEELESKLILKKESKKVYEQKANDTDLKIKKEKNNWKSFKLNFVKAMAGIPIGLLFVFIFCEWIVGNELVQISVQQLIAVLKLGGTVDLVAFILVSIYMIRSEDSCLSQIKQLTEDKKYIDNLIKNLDLEIAALVQVITKNKAELNELREQKEKNNIDRMPIDVQQIYRETLEQELSYLTQLREETKADEQEETEKNSSILGRFMKKKNR